MFYHAGNVVPRPFAVGFVDALPKGVDGAARKDEATLTKIKERASRSRHRERDEAFGAGVNSPSIRRQHRGFFRFGVGRKRT